MCTALNFKTKDHYFGRNLDLDISFNENLSVLQFFHLLPSVEMTRGACKVPSGKYDITVYSSCINTDKGLYYYTTYDKHQIHCVNMNNVDLNGNAISRFPLVLEEQICYQN